MKAEQLLEEYGFCNWDGHKEKIGNFKLEPPGLFRGRGVHPKMGKVKKRITPEEIIINCSRYVNLYKLWFLTGEKFPIKVFLFETQGVILNKVCSLSTHIDD